MAFRRALVPALACLGFLAACGSEDPVGEPGTTSAREPRLRLPYDVEVDRQGRIFVADGELHQVLLYDSATSELTVVAGTGEPGSDGDGGPATEARIAEPVGLALASDGTLYIADFPENRVRRVDPDGTISTLAETRLPAEAALDPDERFLVVSSLTNALRRIDVASGRITTIARVESPHGAAFDGDGSLYFPDGHYLRRLDPGDTAVATIAGNGKEEATGDGGPARNAGIDAVKVLVAPDGSVYVVGGNPQGGTVRRITSDGIIETIVGTGGLSPYGDGGDARDAGILPSDVALAPDGTLVISQTEPEPAIRRVDPDTGLITTVLR